MSKPLTGSVVALDGDWDHSVDDEMLTPDQTAEILHTEPATLANWRSTRRYDLPFTKIGRKVFYLRGHVRRFIHSRTRQYA